MLLDAVVDPAIALQGSATLGEMTEMQVTIIDDEMPGGVDKGFKLVGGANGPVHSVIVDQDERIILGGDFTRVGGVYYGHVSRLHPDGYVDSSFNIGTGLDNIVWSVGVQPDLRLRVGRTQDLGQAWMQEEFALQGPLLGNPTMAAQCLDQESKMLKH